jgi:hypothetical protein
VPPVSMLTRLLVTCVLAVGLTGCSGDDADRPAVDEPVPATVRDGLATLFAGDHPDRTTEEQARCFSEELLGRAGLDRLHAAGVVDGSVVVTDLDTLPPDLAADWADAQMACTDFVEASTRAQVAVSKGAVDADAYAACLRDALDDATVRAALVAGLTGSFEDPSVDRLAAAQDDCAQQSGGA